MVNRKLLTGLIDYAGVFPPAEHELVEALHRYKGAIEAPDGWILGPFLIKASQLTRLDPEDLPDKTGVVLDVPPWRLDGRFDLVQIEMKVEAGSVAAEVRQVTDRAPMVYAEGRYLADSGYLEEIAALREENLDIRAKIRTGGATAAVFPTVDAVAEFIETCVRLRVPFKATPGLYHPFRHPSDLWDATEHGFINVLAAVRAAIAGDHPAVLDALNSSEPAEFEAAEGTWNDVGANIDPERVRGVFQSFGSCSFQELARYLHDLGVLPIDGRS